MAIPDSKKFVRMFKNRDMPVVVQFAKIDPSYSSGRPRLIFDGEQSVTSKSYPYAGIYDPQANDRVMVVNGVVLTDIR